MKINEIFFDINHFLYTEKARELTVTRNSELINISEQQVGDKDIWIVLGDGVHELLKEHHHGVYGRFFGILLAALHEHDSEMPIRAICMGDVHHALEHSTTELLANAIASGTYVQGQINLPPQSDQLR